jgi:hypothetical protein
MNDEVGLFGYLDRVHELAERPAEHRFVCKLV